MGNALCLSRGDKPPGSGGGADGAPSAAAPARVSPMPSFRRRRRRSGDGGAGSTGPPALLDLCVAAVAAAAAAADLDIGVLPSELIQRVADHLIDEGERHAFDYCVPPCFALLGGRGHRPRRLAA